MTPKKNIGPKVDQSALNELGKIFENTNRGATFVLELFPLLYKLGLTELKGLLSKNELSLIIDKFNGSMLDPQFAGRTLNIDLGDFCLFDNAHIKWGVDKEQMLATIENLDNASRTFLTIWAHSFWYGSNQGKDLDSYILPLL